MASHRAVRLTLLKLMSIRTALALLLLLPAGASAQDLEAVLSAVVRISGMREDTPVRGSGFVVGFEGDKATIVTASHVIQGVQQIEVTFAVDLAERFPAGVVLGMETGSPHGLAVFQVRGQLPAGVTALSVDFEKRPRLGESLFLVGFPEMAQAPRTAQRVLAARNGTLLVVDQKVGEGFSGSPVLRGNKVVGVVTDMDEQTTYAVEAVVVQASLEGWGVKLAGACIPGQRATLDHIEYVRICPGTFTMGSASQDLYAEEDEKPPRPVTVSEFWIGRSEVTNAQYRRVRKSHQGEDRLPVVKITWAEANAACEHFGGRLPTEAEWEYAARAGTTTVWSFGGDATLTGEYAWYNQNAGDRPHPVAEKKPNLWGLYDVHGNVWEWVADGALPGHRVLRGGSFSDPAQFVRSANKIGHKPDERKENFGFRCARNAER
jgi:formylglycine-generating enzyme required for sulfatase activity